MVAVLVLLASCAISAEPRRDLFGAKSQGTPQSVKGTIELSNGERMEGRLSLVGVPALELFDLEAKQWRELRLEELARIDAKVRSEAMEKEWRWKESGSDEKVFTGKAYPRRWLDHEITLKDGKRFKAHVRGAVLIVEIERPGADPVKKRLALKQYERGEAGQKLEDLVYVKAIVVEQTGETRRSTP